MKQINCNRLVRYMLEVAGGAVPFAGGLLPAAALVWADKDQDQASMLLNQKLEALAATRSLPNPIFREDDYCAEIVKAHQVRQFKLNRSE